MAQSKSLVKEFFNFNLLVTKQIIQIIYGVGALVLTLGGIILLFTESGFLIGITAIILGNIVWRVICESMILFFKIHEQLNNIRKK